MSHLMEEIHLRSKMSDLIEAQNQVAEMLGSPIFENYHHQLTDIVVNIQNSFDLFYHYTDKYRIVDAAIADAKLENAKLNAENLRLKEELSILRKEMEL